MKRLALLCLLFATTVAFAQAPTRVRGTITGVFGDALMVKTPNGRDIRLFLTPNACTRSARRCRPAIWLGIRFPTR